MKPGIRLQLMLGFMLLLILGGTTSTLVLSRWLGDELREDVLRRASHLARNLAAWSEEAVLTEGRLELLRLISVTRSVDEDVAYVFVRDARGEVLAHSFDGRFPKALGSVVEGRSATRLETEEGLVRDIGAPIRGGRAGEVHVGYSERGVLTGVRRLRRVIWMIAVPILLVGIVAISTLAGLLTRPLRRLTETVRSFGEGNLDSRLGTSHGGEIGALGEAFDSMAENLARQDRDLRALTDFNRRLIDSLDFGIYVLDSEFNVRYANRRLVQEVGEVEGRRCHDVICHQPEPCRHCVAELSRETGKLQRRTCRLPDGRWVEQTAIPAGDGSRSTVVTRRDVTEDVRMREAMTQHEKLAAVGELAAEVAHEVNNPLDGMHGLVRLVLGDASLATESRRHLVLVDEGITRLEMIVRRLLTFTADPADPSMTTTLDEQLDRALVFVRKRLRSGGVELALDLGEERILIRVDPNRFPQVLVNLMLNAADAMPSGGTLTIRTRRADAHLSIEFEDEGVGVSEELREMIFRPFFTTKEAGKGTGLGLAVSRRIVEAHGGRLTVTTVPGGGAAFRIRIPVLEGE